MITRTTVTTVLTISQAPSARPPAQRPGVRGGRSADGKSDPYRPSPKTNEYNDNNNNNDNNT